MINVLLACRKDVEDYFEKSGIRDWKKLTHTPLIVFMVSEETVAIRIVDKPIDLLTFPDETQVMGQWRGGYRSDFFQFTIGQLRQHIAKHPKESYRII